MSRLIFFGLAVEEGLSPVVGAAPFEVLARQIPRLVVKLLNDGQDRGVRCFPFIGPVDGRRQFLASPEMLPVQKLRELSGDQHAGAIIVRGEIDAKALRLCIHDGGDATCLDETLLLDPNDPVPTIKRVLFELCGTLGLKGPSPALPELSGLHAEALGHYLVAMDDLLGLEAGLVREDVGSWLRAIRKCLEVAPEHEATGRLLLEIAARLIGTGTTRQDSVCKDVAELLRSAAEAHHGDTFLATAAALLDKVGQTDAAAMIFERLLASNPDREDVTLRLVAHHFKKGDLARARSLLESAVASGNRSSMILAQLSVVQQRTNDHAAQAATIDELCGRDDLPPGVVRVVAAELTEWDRCGEAVAVIEKGLAAYPRDAGLWLEKARALLRAGDGNTARPALRQALAHDPSAVVRREAQRLLHLAHAPDTLRGLRKVDDALSNDDLPGALRLARRLVRQHRRMGEAWLFLGVVRQRLSHPRRAIRALRRAVACMPELGEAHNRLGILLVQRRRHHEAFEHLQRALHLLPWEVGPRIHMAQACCYLGRKAEGQKALEEAERLGADAKLLEAVRRTFFSA